MQQAGRTRSKLDIGLSPAGIVAVSAIAAVLIAATALLLQWMIYDNWLRSAHPLHYVGTTLAAVLGFLLVYRSQRLMRERQLETVRRFEIVARMNDRIRNALQIIDYTAFASHPQAADQVRYAVDVIDSILREVLVNVGGAGEADSGKTSVPPELPAGAGSGEN